MWTNEITLDTLRVIAESETPTVEVETPKGVWLADRALCRRILAALTKRGIRVDRCELSEKAEPQLHYVTPSGKGFFRLFSAPVKKARKKAQRKPRVVPAAQYLADQEGLK